jgi:hypothetical protein
VHARRTLPPLRLEERGFLANVAPPRLRVKQTFPLIGLAKSEEPHKVTPDSAGSTVAKYVPPLGAAL